MNHPPLSDKEFDLFREMIFRRAGITMSPAKKALVSGRLGKRVQHGKFASFGEYHQHLHSKAGEAELRIAIDLLTTNETYFFREPKHFDFLRDRVAANWQSARPLRVWSAACSSGEEPYSIAMMLTAELGESKWEMLATDISTRVLERARSGHYAMERAERIPRHYLNAYCLKGVREQEGTFLIERRLRDRIRFMHLNLNEALPGDVGEFDVIFLRNVMIYFDMDTKRQVVKRLAQQLRPGGHLLIGHSESLNGVNDQLQMVMPSVYRK